MTKHLIVKITPEEAVPFIRQYNVWSGSTVADENQAKFCVWCGVSIDGVVRAVLGLQPLDEGTIFVWAMFGDGSGTIDERIAGVRLMQIVNNMPFQLKGAILPSNVSQQRRALKNGWIKTDTQIMCGTDDELQDLWERPFKGGQ